MCGNIRDICFPQLEKAQMDDLAVPGLRKLSKFQFLTPLVSGIVISGPKILGSVIKKSIFLITTLSNEG